MSSAKRLTRRDMQIMENPIGQKCKNEDTETVLVKAPPMELLPDRPSTREAVHNVYELKTKPEVIRYYHAAAGFLTKRTWI